MFEQRILSAARYCDLDEAEILEIGRKLSATVQEKIDTSDLSVDEIGKLFVAVRDKVDVNEAMDALLEDIRKRSGCGKIR